VGGFTDLNLYFTKTLPKLSEQKLHSQKMSNPFSILKMNKLSNKDLEQVSEEALMSLADNLAAAAVSFSTHGYDQFIETREQLKSTFCRLASLIKVSQCDPVVHAQRSVERGTGGRRASDTLSAE
jgi:hypothetical protein